MYAVSAGAKAEQSSEEEEGRIKSRTTQIVDEDEAESEVERYKLVTGSFDMLLQGFF